MCAPNSNDITCSITEFDCFSCPILSGESLEELQIYIRLCLSVQSTFEVVIGIAGDYCIPRPDLSKIEDVY